MSSARSASRRACAVLALGLLGSACGPAAPPASPGADGRDGARRFERVEEEVLRDLATIDARLARRARLTPSDDDLRRVTMAAVLREDPTVAVVGGVLDPFSFDARSRGLAAAKAKLAAAPPAPEQDQERALLARLVDAELLRLDDERALPRSASALVRAVVDMWRAPRDAADADELDRWLARRLGDVHASLSSGTGEPLDVVRARELDDALDALERLAVAPLFARTTQELVRLREALDTAATPPPAHSEWTALAARAGAELGAAASPDDLARAFAALAPTLRARAESALRAAGVGKDALEAALDAGVFASGACVDAVPGSRVRSMAAPPEREPSCHLRHFVARADDPAARAVALAVMHDHLVVATWALDVARGAATLATAQDEHHLLVPALPGTLARYERIALARPIAALTAGEAVRVLLDGDPKARAVAWSALGEIPLDAVRRELSARGAAPDATRPGS